jgi:hypothetical protein
MSCCLCVVVRNPGVRIVLFEQEVGLILVLTSVMQRPLTAVSKGALFLGYS